MGTPKLGNTHTHNTRFNSVKFPCGECSGECKENQLSCVLCKEYYHTGACSGVQSSALNTISKSRGFIWLCKKCEEQRRARFSDDVNVQSTNLNLQGIEKQLVEISNNIVRQAKQTGGNTIAVGDIVSPLESLEEKLKESEENSPKKLCVVETKD